MIPILYEKTETTFASNGLGRLSDCISCIVTEERNGIYECQFQYPVNGIHFDDIQDGRIIAVIHDDNKDIQPFDIYKRTEPINGLVTFYARHISYRLSENVTAPFTAATCSAALGGLASHAYLPNDFSFATDKAVTADFALTVPTSIRSALGGTEGSILDVYGGEYKFDKFNVYLYARRGSDTTVAIRYGTNLVDYTDETDHGSSYNAAVPYWTGSDGNSGGMTTVIGSVVNSGETVYSGRTVAVPMDLSQQFTSKPTAAQLNTRAASVLASSDAWLPDENITLNFVPLWQTEEYKDYMAVQRLNLCDTALIFFERYNKTARMKVVRVQYNVLLERYDEMELGQLQTSLAAAINASVEKKVSEQESQILGIGQIAGNTNQHFWFTSTGTDTGAHITEVDRETFEADRANGGPNLLARTSGIALRDGTTELSKFNANGIQVGQDSKGRIIVDSSSVDVYTPENDLGMQITTLYDSYSRPVEVVAVGGQAGLEEQTPGHRVQLESSPGLWTALEAYAAQGQNVDFSIRANEWNSVDQEYEGVGNILFDHKDVRIVSENDVKISTGASGLASRNVIIDNGISCTDGGGYNLARGDGGVLQIGAYEQSNYGNCERVHINVRHHTNLGNTFQVLGRYTDNGTYTNYAYIRAGVDTTSEFVKLPPAYNRTVSGGRAMYAASDGTIGRSTSSERFKNSIRRLTEERQQKERERLLEGIRNISPAFFKFNEGHFGPDDGWDYDKDVLGFIAEDVAKAVPEAAVHNDENPELIDDWDMRQLVPALLLLAQEAMNRVEQLEKELEAIKRDK